MQYAIEHTQGEKESRGTDEEHDITKHDITTERFQLICYCNTRRVSLLIIDGRHPGRLRSEHFYLAATVKYLYRQAECFMYMYRLYFVYNYIQLYFAGYGSSVKL